MVVIRLTRAGLAESVRHLAAKVSLACLDIHLVCVGGVVFDYGFEVLAKKWLVRLKS